MGTMFTDFRQTLIRAKCPGLRGLVKEEASPVATFKFSVPKKGPIGSAVFYIRELNLMSKHCKCSKSWNSCLICWIAAAAVVSRLHKSSYDIDVSILSLGLLSKHPGAVKISGSVRCLLWEDALERADSRISTPPPRLSTLPQHILMCADWKLEYCLLKMFSLFVFLV